MVIANLKIICRGRCLHRPWPFVPYTILGKRYDIRSAGAQCAPLRSLWGKRVLQYVLSVFCLPVRYPIPILKFFRRSLFFEKGWESSRKQSLCRAKAFGGHHGPAGGGKLFGHLHVAAVGQVADQPCIRNCSLLMALTSCGSGFWRTLAHRKRYRRQQAA